LFDILIFGAATLVLGNLFAGDSKTDANLMELQCETDASRWIYITMCRELATIKSTELSV